MFGAFRFLLAIIVVTGHLRGPFWIGTYAVFAFYIISGYLMCLVMNKRYQFTRHGIKAFAKNRFLRIFPPYWVACFLTLMLIAVAPPDVLHEYKSALAVPNSFGEWIKNLAIFGLQADIPSRLVPPAWSLYVELMFYGGIALILGRSRRIALVWLVISVGYHVFLAFTDYDWRTRYYPVVAGSLPFSIGAIIYHYKPFLDNYVLRPRALLIVFTLLWLLNFQFAFFVFRQLSDVPFYLNCFFSAIIIWLLTFRYSASTYIRSLDSWFGDISYPIYLMHWQIGFIVMSLFSLERRGPHLLISTLPVLIFVSWLMKVLVDDRMERIRDRVKSSLVAFDRSLQTMP